MFLWTKLLDHILNIHPDRYLQTRQDAKPMILEGQNRLLATKRNRLHYSGAAKNCLNQTYLWPYKL